MAHFTAHRQDGCTGHSTSCIAWGGCTSSWTRALKLGPVVPVVGPVVPARLHQWEHTGW